MTKSILDRLPPKVLRFGFRLPVLLYRSKLGGLLGNRFLLLTHTGRKSGLAHETVIEVVRYDPETDTYYAVSGLGEKSDWYQNIRKSPRVTIDVGRRKLQAVAECIPLEKSIEVMASYALKHPFAFSELSSLFLGERIEPTAEGAQRLVEKMPMVAFHPVPYT